VVKATAANPFAVLEVESGDTPSGSSDTEAAILSAQTTATLQQALALARADANHARMELSLHHEQYQQAVRQQSVLAVRQQEAQAFEEQLFIREQQLSSATAAARAQQPPSQVRIAPSSTTQQTNSVQQQQTNKFHHTQPQQHQSQQTNKVQQLQQQPQPQQTHNFHQPQQFQRWPVLTNLFGARHILGGRRRRLCGLLFGRSRPSGRPRILFFCRSRPSCPGFTEVIFITTHSPTHLLT
jgi:hypothetical protein